MRLYIRICTHLQYLYVLLHLCLIRFVFSMCFCCHQVVLLMFLATTATALSTCQSGIVCTNSTHFKLCVVFANGSISLWNQSTACPQKTVCNVSQCLDVYPSGYTPDSRRCSINGFICTNRQDYQLCVFDRHGYSYPWGPYYHCPPNTVCNETHPYHCQVLHPSIYAPTTTGQLPAPTRDECKSKNFVCIDSSTYLICRNMGDGTFKPFNEQYKCPSTHTCHKSFDRPCAVAKSRGNDIYSNNWKGFGVLILLQVVHFYW